MLKSDPPTDLYVVSMECDKEDHKLEQGARDVSEREGDNEIYVMDTDGSNVVQLTHNTAFDTSPSWSPDGRRIVFVSDRDEATEIYLMDTDGSNVVQLTKNATYESVPSWSPDGRRIAFSSDRDGQSHIYTMNWDGSNQRKLTSFGENMSPAWSSFPGGDGEEEVPAKAD